MASGGKAVGNEYDRFIRRRFRNAVVELIFRYGVERAGGFVHDKKLAGLCKHASDGYLLFFAARKVCAVLVKFTGKLGIYAFFKRAKLLIEGALLKRCQNRFSCCAVVNVCKHVFRDGRGEYLIILKNCTDASAVSIKIIFFDVNTVIQNLTLGGVVKPHKKLYKRCLARAVVADEGNFIAARNFKAYTFQNFVLLICKSYVFELKAFKCAGNLASAYYLRLIREKHFHLVYEKRVLFGFHYSVKQVAQEPRKLPYCGYARRKIAEGYAFRHEKLVEQKQNYHTVAEAHHAPSGNREPIARCRIFPHKPLFLLDGFCVLVEQVFRNARKANLLSAIGKAEHTVYVICLSVERVKILCSFVVDFRCPHLKHYARCGEKQNYRREYRVYRNDKPRYENRRYCSVNEFAKVV